MILYDDASRIDMCHVGKFVQADMELCWFGNVYNRQLCMRTQSCQYLSKLSNDLLSAIALSLQIIHAVQSPVNNNKRTAKTSNSMCNKQTIAFVMCEQHQQQEEQHEHKQERD